MHIKKNKKKNLTSILNITKIKPYKIKSNEKYMNIDQKNHFKKILLYLYNKLTNKINNNQNKKSINFPDPIDRAVQEEEFTFTLRYKNRERKLINKILKTIKKIKLNNFGYCDICEIEIGIKRLEAQPIANLCIDCKILSEIKKNH